MVLLPLYYLCLLEELISQTLSKWLSAATTPPPKPNIAQITTTKTGQNLFKSIKDFSEECCSLFLDSMQSMFMHPVPKVLWDVRSVANRHIQKCMFSLFAGKWICQSWQKVPWDSKFLTLFFMDDWWASYFAKQHEHLTAGLTVLPCPRFIVLGFYCKSSNPASCS